jgi:predicted acyl esterase
MRLIGNVRPGIVLAALAAVGGAAVSSAQTASPPPPQYPSYPSETPATLRPATEGFDHDRREVMIPMRDGVKLHTVILVPKGAHGAPILLTRTPLQRERAHEPRPQRPPRAPSLSGYDNATDVIVEGGYIRVVQDIRGKYDSRATT